VGVFLTQGVLIGWVGTAIGVALGLAIAFNVPFLEELLNWHLPSDVYYIPDFPSEVHGSDVVSIAVASLLLTLLATIYPALQAAKTQPAEALRYE